VREPVDDSVGAGAMQVRLKVASSPATSPSRTLSSEEQAVVKLAISAAIIIVAESFLKVFIEMNV
jgi:hypothetical protein